MISDERITVPNMADDGPGPSPSVVDGALVADPSASTPCHAPDLVGLSALEAYAEARAAGVRLSVSVWETRVGPWGLVIDQRPGTGTRVRRGARLSVIVSGRPHAPVPDVRGLPLETAIERLGWLGFVPLVKERRVSSSVPTGHVLSSYPDAGTLLTDGSVVALTLARFVEERPPLVGQTGSKGR